jgi:NAD(P)-dependent dehydrogenase (short-subunit alcohol dehydrogenase family)
VLKHQTVDHFSLWGLEDKVAIVTGAGRGIGAATARAFAAAGAVTIVMDRDEPEARDVAEQIWKAGGRAEVCVCDVAEEDQISNALDQVVRRHRRIDTLFANAAVQTTAPAADIDAQEWDRLHKVNVRGTFLCCKYAIPAMRNAKRGAIVIAASGHAFATYPNCSAYASTKGALVAFMRGVALDYAADGIRANCVIPGATDTRLIRDYCEQSGHPEQALDRILGTIPMRRLAEPEEIATAVLFLASPLAGYITGTCLAVDGGLLAQA